MLKNKNGEFILDYNQLRALVSDDHAGKTTAEYGGDFGIRTTALKTIRAVIDEVGRYFPHEEVVITVRRKRTNAA